MQSEAPVPPPGRQNPAPAADVYDDSNPMGIALAWLKCFTPDYDAYDPKHTMQYPGGGLQSVRGKTNE